MQDGGQFKCIFSHLRCVNFKIFSNHGGVLKFIMKKTGPMCMTARIYNFVEYIGVREYSGNTQGFFSPKIMWLHCASAKMHLNVGLTISCTECKKSRLFYAKYKLKSNELTSLKRIWNDIMYVELLWKIFQSMNETKIVVFVNACISERIWNVSQILKCHTIQLKFLKKYMHFLWN